MDEKTRDKLERALELMQDAQAIAEELWPTPPPQTTEQPAPPTD